MTGLILANIYAPGRKWHGTTVTIRPEDPHGDCAYADAVCRYANEMPRVRDQDHIVDTNEMVEGGRGR